MFFVPCDIPVAPLGLRCAGFRRFYKPSAPLGFTNAGAKRQIGDLMIEIGFKTNGSARHEFPNRL